MTAAAPREDANAIALRAVRAVLRAAHDFTVNLAGKQVSVEVTRRPEPAWPRKLNGLDEAADGPWPTPIGLVARWGDGEARLLMRCDFWRRRDEFAHFCGLRVAVEETGREMLWNTVGFSLYEAQDGDTCRIPGSIALARPYAEESIPAFNTLGPKLRETLRIPEIPLISPANAELFSVRVPGGEILPDARTAFRRVAIVAIAKHAFFERRDRAGIRGEPLLDVPFVLDSAPAAPGQPAAAPPAAGEDARKAGIWPLPGGVRAYARTLEALLRAISDHEPMEIAAFNRLLIEQFEASGQTAQASYRGMLRALRLVEQAGGRLTLTTLGQSWLQTPDPIDLFEIAHREFIGMLEPLVLAAEAPACPRDEAYRLLNALLRVDWKTGVQVDMRRNWLLSLGLTERRPDGDTLTDAGRGVLDRHAGEVEPIRAALRGLLAAETPLDPEPEEEIAELDGEAAGAAEPDGVAAAWLSEHLDLTEANAAPFLGSLRLPARTLGQICAALSSGKHLLLVGPPGTGKSQLAEALARAAASEGYCAGLFTATASADWTTFDTIGGYALESDNALEFREGAFLRAISERKWLLVDELNRADVDRAFGELMTVLAGQGTDTPYTRRGRTISIGPEEGRTHRVPGCFRVIATMNTWDKTSLFRLSFAVQRRFAVVTVGIPADETYAEILEAAAFSPGPLAPLSAPLLPPLAHLFSRAGLLQLREIGPAVGKDLVRYLRRRGPSADGIAEGIEMYVLPQLMGLDEAGAAKARALCVAALGGGASEAARASLEARFAESFPLLEPWGE